MTEGADDLTQDERRIMMEFDRSASLDFFLLALSDVVLLQYQH